jgi:queuine tRNA-ribosyltransferase
MQSLNFEILKSSGEARLGRLSTPHGVIDTPVFMPVGTQATVKSVLPRDLWDTGTRICLSNAYHLYLRPGPELISKAGGLHRFMGWRGAVLTDSGGFQVMSLGRNVSIDDSGASFRSHIDGHEIKFTPETSVKTQTLLGADIIMCFDHLVPYPVDHSVAADAMERTLNWARRCKSVKIPENQWLFGIVQGSVYPDLRKKSAEELAAMDFPGYALGGFSVGESKKSFYDCVEICVRNLPTDKPKYLMGVGHPADLVHGAMQGVDMFDCVLPTRNARHGRAFTFQGYYNMKNAKYKEDYLPVEEDCDCLLCKTYSRAYLRHLFHAGETLAWTLLSIHNIRFFQRLMAKIRNAIKEDRLTEILSQVLDLYPIEDV